MSATTDKIKGLTQGLTQDNLQQSKAEISAIASTVDTLPAQEANEVRQAIEGFNQARFRLFGM
ncbi:MAG TPA: hypothetical protein V6C57_13070 [Coleofasciculaceae cyanobacterium]